MTKKIWSGSPPKTCNICPRSITTEFSDAVFPGVGSWVNFCPDCAKRHGVRYGYGLGQRYVRNNDGEFEKVEG